MNIIREKITSTFNEILSESGHGLSSPLGDDTVLLESGLDSMGFAILVTRLEDELGYDPFVIMDEPVYPKTFGQFVSIYEKFAPAENG